MRSEPTMFAGKDHTNPRTGVGAVAALWWQGGITDPLVISGSELVPWCTACRTGWSTGTWRGWAVLPSSGGLA